MSDLPRPTAKERTASMDDAALRDAVKAGGRLRGAALFELVDRARARPELVAELGELARFPALREDRLFHLVSAAWAAISGLLSIENEQSRRLGYEAFYELDERDRDLFLRYLKAERIEDAHPVV